MMEPKLLLSPLQQSLELRVREEGDGHDVPAPVLADIHRKVPLRHVPGQPPVVLTSPPQAGAPLQYLLQCCSLLELVRLLNAHPFFGYTRRVSTIRKRELSLFELSFGGYLRSGEEQMHVVG